MTVLVFGSAVADLVFRLPHLPRPGETVLGEAGAMLPGGKGANQALAAARAGAAVGFAGAVGADAAAEVVLAPLRAAGVNLSRLRVAAAPTGLAAVCVDQAGANQIAVSVGANAFARASQLADADLGPGAILLLQMEVPAVENAQAVARARGARAILNLAPAGAMPPEALRALHLLVANEPEAAWLAGQFGCGADAASLHAALGIGVVVTLAERGAEAATDAGGVRAAAFPITPVDTTGAGDCWCGVLAAGLDQGMPLAAAMLRANAAAAIACTRPGAGTAMPLLAEIEALLRGA